MLHHTNVDRQLALFQYIYKDTYIQPAINGPTYTIVSGSTQDENSPLTPFHSNAQGSFITSKMARFTDNWGYTYPEILGNPSNATVRAKVTSLYGPSTTSLKKRAEEDSARAYLAEVDIPVTGEQYTVRVAVGGEHVGSHSTLARQSVHDTGMTNTGSVDLNAILKKKHDAGDLKGLDVDAITAYLKENLSYTVKKAGSEVSKDIEGLKVSVISTQVVPPTSSSDFPKWVGGFEEHDDVKSE